MTGWPAASQVFQYYDGACRRPFVGEPTLTKMDVYPVQSITALFTGDRLAHPVPQVKAITGETPTSHPLTFTDTCIPYYCSTSCKSWADRRCLMLSKSRHHRGYPPLATRPPSPKRVYHAVAPLAQILGRQASPHPQQVKPSRGKPPTGHPPTATNTCIVYHGTCCRNLLQQTRVVSSSAHTRTNGYVSGVTIVLYVYMLRDAGSVFRSAQK